MSDVSPKSKLIVALARPEAFVDKTLQILRRLGYQIVNREEFDGLHRATGDSDGLPLFLADERSLDELPGHDADEMPRVVLLSGRQGATGQDPRIVAAVKKPVGLHDLYRVLQELFQDTPRAAPRVSTHLRATCTRRDRSWEGVLLSLSENGGLLRSNEPLPLGSKFVLEFDLPRLGPIRLEAEAAYQILPDIGVVFSGLDSQIRDAIEAHVRHTILGD
jgi:hypothetical protein